MPTAGLVKRGQSVIESGGGRLLKCRQRTEKCFTVGVASRMDKAASSENNVKIDHYMKF
jgi:hypothetical protein